MSVYVAGGGLTSVGAGSSTRVIEIPPMVEFRIKCYLSYAKILSSYVTSWRNTVWELDDGQTSANAANDFGQLLPVTGRVAPSTPTIATLLGAVQAANYATAKEELVKSGGPYNLTITTNDDSIVWGLGANDDLSVTVAESSGDSITFTASNPPLY